MMNFLNNLPPRMFTGLQARITQEEAGFRISIQLQNNLNPGDPVWGVEIASTIEMASGMIAQLAQQFSIPEKSISINIAMNNFRENTFH
jgi:hypothetical protein